MEKKPLQPLGRGGKITLIVLGSIFALSACLWLGVSIASGGFGSYVLFSALSLLAAAGAWGIFFFRRKERSVHALSLGGMALSYVSLVLSVGGTVLSVVALLIRGSNTFALFCIAILATLAGMIMGVVTACISDGKRGQLAVGIVAAVFPVFAMLLVIGLSLVGGVPVIRFM